MNAETIPQHHSSLHWKEVLLALLALAVFAAVVAAGLVLDRREDRERPMYRDVVTVAGLEWDLLAQGQSGVELTVDSGSGPVMIGSTSFEPSSGVSIVVEQRDDAFCVQGRNRYGDVTSWDCVDGTDTRPDLGSLDSAAG